MHSFNESFVALQRGCQASTTFMLVKALKANGLSQTALAEFDQISDYPTDVALDPQLRAKLVAELLGKSLNVVAASGDAQ
ncbi:hypothetical protein V0M98_32200 (plasmid) [Pseudomonas silesiensis]|uniref:hypothetical protein n=1 Tax=Pseudomonas silesiensis TaxID=1853130 RepID=UPI0030D105FD